MASEAILTERLELRPMSAELLEALIAGDAARLAGIVGSNPEVPVRPPPEMGDVLPFMLERVRADPAVAHWWGWLQVRREDRAVVGSAGFGGPPTDGAATIGYAVYPEYEGNGYAREATRGLIGWALGQAGAMRVRATIPPWHTASLRVAAKAGMRMVGTDSDPEVGEVQVWEATRPDSDEGGDNPTSSAR